MMCPFCEVSPFTSFFDSTNDFQPSSGDCEWKGNTRNGFCRTAPKDDRMRCSGRTTRNWCTNDFQPRSGGCEWRHGKCREESRGGASCRDRGNRGWCENGRGGELSQFGCDQYWMKSLVVYNSHALSLSSFIIGVTCRWNRNRNQCENDRKPPPPPPKRDSKSKKKADCSGRSRKSCMDKKGCEYVSRKKGNSFCRSSKKDDEDSSDYDFESVSEDYDFDLAVE